MPAPVVTAVPFTITPPATLIIAPPAIVRICNNDVINSAMFDTTFIAVNLPNQSITPTIASPSPCKSSGNSSTASSILSIISDQFSAILSLPKKLPLNIELNVSTNPSPSMGAISTPICVKSIAKSPMPLIALAIADPYFSSIKSHDSFNADCRLSKLIS